MHIKASEKNLVLGVALAIFIFGLAQGWAIAVRKPLWTDEIYSQVDNVQNKTFTAIWTGRMAEGNNAPLFYVLQKGLCSWMNYNGGDLWHKDDPAARFILRISPVIFMALGLAFIFVYFSRLYSVVFGGLAFLMALSTYLVWAYWAEARPYAMVFFGTAIQSAVLFNAFRSVDREATWRPVALANIFLALTWPLSVIQALAAAVMLWFAGHRKLLPFLAMIAVPLVIAFGYHAMRTGGPLTFWFASYGQPMDLIKSAIPEGRFQFLVIAPVILWLLARKEKTGVSREVWLFLAWAGLVILGYILFMMYFWFRQTPPVGFELSNRYMIPLAPISIAAIVLLCVELTRRARGVWGSLLAWGVILAMILPRLVKIFHWAARPF